MIGFAAAMFSLIPSAILAGYVPFVYPLPVWDYWPWLILPLAAGVSIVYKSVKCQSMRTVPKEAATIFVWILIGMVAAGAALAGVVKIVVER
jgi:hypothetical protein